MATGMWSKEQITANRQIERRFIPAMDEGQRSALYRGWNKAVDRTKGWLKE